MTEPDEEVFSLIWGNLLVIAAICGIGTLGWLSPLFFGFGGAVLVRSFVRHQLPVLKFYWEVVSTYVKSEVRKNS